MCSSPGDSVSVLHLNDRIEPRKSNPAADQSAEPTASVTGAILLSSAELRRHPSVQARAGIAIP
jgi:hypothetical protein